MSDGRARPDDPVEAAREAALRLIERARKTRRELERRLAEKGYAPAAAQAALDRLARVGLVDDVEYARAFVRSRLARRAVALRVLRQHLRARGVAEDDIEQALAGLDAEAGLEAAAGGDAPESHGSGPAALRRLGGEGERARARAALAPLLRRYRNLDPAEARAKAAAALARRGFDFGTVRDVVEDAFLAAPASPDDPS